MAKDHFVPRHYLRQFATSRPEYIVAANVSPYRFVGPKGIGGQCQEADFYEGNKALDKLLGTCENDLAPVLVRVVQKEDFTEPELVALRWLAVTLHTRTKKAAEAYKVFPKRLIYEVLRSAIKNGKLPPPPEGPLTEEMFDFKGVSGFLIKNAGIRCSLEMQTLACKLLKAEGGTCFITSDNPVVILNQFCVSAEPHRSFVGFSKSGFQLLLPISPALCLFFYDAKTYKVGSPRHRLICISKDDVEVVNALQIQSAEECVYFHEPKLESEVQCLIGRYAQLRVPVQDGLRTFPGSKQKEQVLHFRKLSVKLPKAWGFCRPRRHIKCQVGDRRNPPWSALIEELVNDFENHPDGGDALTRVEKILADPNSLKNIRIR
ncbi:MAG: DUF4238 domain-containing protein [Limisphaerales bacterium]